MKRNLNNRSSFALCQIELSKEKTNRENRLLNGINTNFCFIIDLQLLWNKSVYKYFNHSSCHGSNYYCKG